MNAPDPAQSGKAPAGRSFRRLRLVGWIFVAMGALAILLPVAATVAAEALVAWLLAGLWLLVWGGALATLLSVGRQAGNAFALTRQELQQDWREIKEHL